MQSHTASAALSVRLPGFARLLFVVLLPFGAGYFLSYLFRNINAVVGKYLIADIGLSASDIGLLTAAYFLTFALCQIPAGVLLDRFGPRRVNGTLLCIAALGALVFSLAESRDSLAIARGLIGVGVSVCLMSSFQAVTLWFPRERWPLLNAIILTFGGFGAIAGTGPVEAALALTDWRGIFRALSIATICVAAAILLIVPDRPSDKEPERLGSIIVGLGRVLRSRAYWAVVPMVVFVQAANLAIIGLWAGLWLRDVPQLGRESTAWILTLLNIGMTAGFLCTGLAGEWANRRAVALARVMTVFCIGFFAAQGIILLKLDVAMGWPWMLFGFFANAVIFAYPMLAARLPLAFSGRVNTSVNLMSFIGGFAGQYAIGAVIDLFPPAAGGLYPIAAYDVAFGGLLILQLLAFAWYLVAFRRA
jgi:sugar phosphate permease